MNVLLLLLQLRLLLILLKGLFHDPVDTTLSWRMNVLHATATDSVKRAIIAMQLIH